MFHSADPQWQRVYAVLTDAEVDQVVTYDEFEDATGVDVRVDRKPLYRAVRELEREQYRTVSCVRNRGYRLVHAREHEGLARNHQRRAHRQVRRAKNKITSADRRELSNEDCKRLDDFETQLAHQASILRNTNRRVEEVDQHRKADSRRLNEEVALLDQRVQQLQEQIGRTSTA